jgi:hypothetical protein
MYDTASTSSSHGEIKIRSGIADHKLGFLDSLHSPSAGHYSGTGLAPPGISFFKYGSAALPSYPKIPLETWLESRQSSSPDRRELEKEQKPGQAERPIPLLKSP